MIHSCSTSASSRKHRLNRAGFTFVEVLAAMIFLGVLIPVILHGLAVANRAAVAAERRTIASQLGYNLLTEYSLSNLWQNAPGSGNFAPEFENFEWFLQQQTWQEDTMRELRLEVTYPVQGQTFSLTLSTLVDESQ